VAQSNQDEKLAKRSDERGSRLSAERAVTEDRETSDAVRLAEKLSILRDVNTKLPTPPSLPGFHLCWLTTTNQSDPLEHRFRLGYELVKPEEMPGFCLPSQQSGTIQTDRICVNEMVLAKIEMSLWESYMKYLHHDLPLEQISSLKDSVQITKDGRGRDVGYTGQEFNNGLTDGFTQLRSARGKPSFAGVA
jgi:hypothetical protein